MIELSNREISVLLWTGAFFLWAMRYRAVRRATVRLFWSFCHSVILAMCGLAAAYVAACVWLLNAAGIWQLTNLKTTVLWAVTFAFLTMMEVARSKEGVKSLKGILKDTVNATAIVLFIAEFHVFSLWIELILVPFLTLVATLLAVAEHKPEHSIVVKPLSFIQGAAGLGIVGYSVIRILQDIAGFATTDTAREFGVPILLSLMFLPFLYMFVVYTTYENAAIRLRFAVKDDKLRRYAFRQAALGLRLDLELLKRFVRRLQLADISDRAGVHREIRDLRTLRWRERNPPLVPWPAGWSPYRAREFLDDLDLLTEDYHPSLGDWWAESPPREVGVGVLKDRLTYRVVGSKDAATLLELVLYATRLEQAESSDEEFWDAAVRLVSRAAGEKAAQSFRRECANRDQAAIQSGLLAISVGYDEWGDARVGRYERRLEIRHKAHVAKNPS